MKILLIHNDPDVLFINQLIAKIKHVDLLCDLNLINLLNILKSYYLIKYLLITSAEYLMLLLIKIKIYIFVSLEDLILFFNNSTSV